MAANRLPASLMNALDPAAGARRSRLTAARAGAPRCPYISRRSRPASGQTLTVPSSFRRGELPRRLRAPFARNVIPGAHAATWPALRAPAALYVWTGINKLLDPVLLGPYRAYPKEAKCMLRRSAFVLIGLAVGCASVQNTPAQDAVWAAYNQCCAEGRVPSNVQLMRVDPDGRAYYQTYTS